MQYIIIDVWVTDVSDGIIWSIFQIWSAPTGYEELEANQKLQGIFNSKEW